MTGPLPPRSDEHRLARLTREIGKFRELVDSSPSIEPNSSLAADDQAFPPYPASQVAWVAIGSAIDHIHMIVTTVNATQTLYPFGYDTLARTGLIGAARALWVLDGSRQERVSRALRIAHEDYRQEQKPHREMRDMFPQHAAAYDEAIAELDHLRTEAQAAGQRIGTDPEDVARKPIDTEIIQHVAQRLADGEDEPELIVAAYVLGWRDGSGNAHGTRWTAIRRSATVEKDAGGRPRYRASGDLHRLMEAVGRAHLLTCKAVELYNLRRLPAAAGP